MIGETIGNFKLVKRLGAGGMGEVFLAEHKELQTPVAVKLLSDNVSHDHEHVQRFFNEARIVSKIKHAGIVKIFDSGFYKDQAYLIMELLDGESLASRIESAGAMSVASIVDVSRQIASVLDATHRQGVIHRDLKPDNIYLVGDDERSNGERVKVLDFGIAKLSGTMAIVSPKTSGTMGTPAYMAPEQWGDSSNVDWRVDAYSLGCVMFEMACGRPPFLAATIPEAYVKHTQTAPPAPSSLAPGLPPALEQLILRLLAKEPADRAVSMGQVTRELAELAGEPLSNEPRRVSSPAVATFTPNPTTLGASAAEIVAPPRRRTKLVVGAVGAAAVAMVAVVVLVAVNKTDKKDARAHATGSPTAGQAAPPQPAVPPPVDKPVIEKPPVIPPSVDKPVIEKPPVVTADKPPVAATIEKPKPKPIVKPKPKPTGTGSAKPPDDDGGWGGRL